MIYNYYQIKNLINNKIYIGITELPVEKRFSQHKHMLINNTHPNYLLQPDWNIYGEKNFSFELIESLNFDNIEDGYYHEYELIQNSTNELYNIQPGGIVNPIKNARSYEKMVQTKQAAVPDVYCLEEITENCFKIIGQYASQKEAGRARPNWGQGTINAAIKKHIKGSGYYWVLQSDIDNNLKNWKPKRIRFRPTALIDENKNILEVHYNAREFEKINNYKPGVISASICHGNRCFGKQYIYISEEKYYELMPITLIK